MKPTTLLARALFCLLVFSFTANLSVVAQQRPPVARNRTITAIVRDIDARNIEQSIRKLVSFGTRNT